MKNKSWKSHFEIKILFHWYKRDIPITPLNSCNINIQVEVYGSSKDRQWNKGNVLCVVHDK